jgi:nucleotide-binding universal stress UspA family protein
MIHTRILVPVSYADGHEPAFERGLALARASGAELHLIHAVPADQSFSSRASLRLRRSAELRGRADAAGVTVQTIEQHGDPAGVIALYADDREVDLIVMTSERRTGWARFRQPSVAERVMRRTARPILVVRHDDAAAAAAFRNVLVAVDLSPASTTLIDMAVQLSEPDTRRLTVIHAVEGVEGAGAVRNRARWVVPEYRAFVLNDDRRRLEAMVRGTAADSAAQLRVVAGSAVDAVVEEAAYLHADLIVVGRSDRLMRWGSTGIRVLRESDRAVLVVPEAASRRLSATEPSLRRAA